MNVDQITDVVREITDRTDSIDDWLAEEGIEQEAIAVVLRMLMLAAVADISDGHHDPLSVLPVVGGMGFQLGWEAAKRQAKSVETAVV